MPLGKEHRKTNNKRGVMHPLSSLSQQFSLFAKNKTVMDMGCAFGNTVLDALKNGADKVIACDMETTHLKEVQNLEKDLSQKVETHQGVFPEDFNFAEDSLDAIHISHLLEYLNGREVEQGLKKCFEWLRPGAKLFILTYSIFILELNNDKFKTEYQQRKSTKTKWPGYLEDYDYYCTEEDHDDKASQTPADAAEFPPSLHLFELEVLKTALEQIGFKIESATYFDGKENGAVSETWLDGQEYLGIVAYKP